MKRFGRSGLVVIWVAWLGFTPAMAALADACAGPAWQTFELTLETGTRTEMAGPFYYRQQRGTETTIAWPPFFSRCTNPALEAREDNYLYPMLSYNVYGKEYHWQFAQMLNFAGGSYPEDGDARRFTIYPLYFQQRSTNADENYTAVVPFYGHIKHRLMLNDVYFVMFPFYAETRKKGYVTDNYLYPFVSLRQGDHLEGWKAWPLAGHEHKEITWTTNGFGEVTTVPGHDKFFALWPIYHKTATGLGSENPEYSEGAIPFYTQSRSPERDETSVLWPFFSWIDDRQKHYHEWQGPWPLVVFTRGEGKHTSRVWPVFSESANAKQESDSYLWPLYQYRGFHSDLVASERHRVMFYLYESTVEHNLAKGTEKRRLDMWPFFTWHRDEHGSTRLQVFAPIEPALNEQRGVNRNWSPLWSVWRAEDNATNGHSSRSLLWNLYRSESTATTKKSSLLFGLFQYMHAGDTDRWHCFYGLDFNLSKQVNTPVQ